MKGGYTRERSRSRRTRRSSRRWRDSIPDRVCGVEVSKEKKKGVMVML